MAPQTKRAYCFQIPKVERSPAAGYNKYAGQLVFTLAVSPEQAANNAIYRTLHPRFGSQFRIITKYLHEILNLSNSTLDLDELDEPTVQPGLFGGQTSSHRRRDEGRLAKKISEKFSTLSKGENSPPRRIAREFVQHRRYHPLTK